VVRLSFFFCLSLTVTPCATPLLALPLHNNDATNARAHPHMHARPPLHTHTLAPACAYAHTPAPAHVHARPCTPTYATPTHSPPSVHAPAYAHAVAPAPARSHPRPPAHTRTQVLFFLFLFFTPDADPCVIPLHSHPPAFLRDTGNTHGT
jgi:hypothetical protein